MERRSFIQAGAAAVLGSLPRFALAAAAADVRSEAGRLAHLRDHDPSRDPQAARRIARLDPGAVGRKRLPEGHRQHLDGQRLDAQSRRDRQVWRRHGGRANGRPGGESSGRRGGEHVRDRNRAVDFCRHDPSIKIDAATAKFATAPTELIPTDGIVRKTAYEITRGKSTDIDKARAIYDWIVDNTHRNPKTRGCGVGDIKAMLETGNLAASAPT